MHLADDLSVGAWTSDAALLQLAHQRPFIVTRRGLGELLLRRHPGRLHKRQRFAFGQLGQRTIGRRLIPYGLFCPSLRAVLIDGASAVASATIGRLVRFVALFGCRSRLLQSFVVGFQPPAKSKHAP